MQKEKINLENLTELDLEVYRLFVNNLFNLIALSKAKLKTDSDYVYFMKLTDKNFIKNSFQYSSKFNSVIYRNMAGFIIFNPGIKNGILKFLQAFDSNVIKKELIEFEKEINREINNM